MRMPRATPRVKLERVLFLPAPPNAVEGARRPRPALRDARPSGAGLGDDLVGVAAEGVELGLERLGVGARLVGPAEPDDHVGDALLLEGAQAVDRVRVDRGGE